MKTKTQALSPQPSALSHTPGPYRIVGGDSVHVPTIHIFADAENAPFAVAHVFGDTPEHARANARLIAAAPDLLAALQYIEARLADAVDFGVLDKSPFYPSWQRARAAIAKAQNPPEE